MKSAVCFLVVLFGGIMAYPVGNYEMMEELRDMFNSLNTAIINDAIIKKKSLTKNDDYLTKEDDTPNKMDPKVKGHFISTDVDGKDHKKKHPNSKFNTERNNGHFSPRSRPSHIDENSKKEMLKEKNIEREDEKYQKWGPDVFQQKAKNEIFSLPALLKEELRKRAFRFGHNN